MLVIFLAHSETVYGQYPTEHYGLELIGNLPI